MLGLGRGDELNALLGSQHASLYPPITPPVFHGLPKLCGPPMYVKDVAPHWSMGRRSTSPMHAPTVALRSGRR